MNIESETKLAPEVESLIKIQVFKAIVPTGIFLSVLSFAIGFFLNDWARGAAYADAYGEAFKSSFDSIEEVTTSIVNSERDIALSKELATNASLEANLAAKNAKQTVAGLQDIIGGGEYSKVAEQVFSLIKSDSEFLRQTDGWVQGTLLINALDPSCPKGFKEAGSIALDVNDRSQLLDIFKANGTYDIRNIRDGSETVQGHDAVGFFTCVKEI